MISHVTRLDIIGALSEEKIAWHGRLQEADFLSRIYDLKNLPSMDPRYGDAAGDIWKHRENNYDWPDEWFIDDERLELGNGPDEVFLKFLCEMIHPEMRRDPAEVTRIVRIVNRYLSEEGWQLVEQSRIGTRPLFEARPLPLEATVGQSASRTETGIFAPEGKSNVGSSKSGKPTVFVGSSVEGLKIAYAIQTNLQHDAFVVVWPQGTFMPGCVSVDSLSEALNKADFGVFVLSPDDKAEIRHEEVLSARDNVLFELGMFIGRLGRERSYLVVPVGQQSIHIPTDLLGIIPVRFDSAYLADNPEAALGPACNQIRRAIEKAHADV